MLRNPGFLRLFWKTDVTICIPAFQAASFIDRTLRCAQGQTYGRLRILVAVDRSEDETARICREFSKADRRIEVIEHGQRLGWCGNVNSLLERAETPFFFVYFHDDLILPQYCEELRWTLLRSPEATSAHCDLFAFGLTNRLSPGRTYQGSMAQRMLTLFAVSERGRPLRSIIRRERIGSDYRLPEGEPNSFTPGRVLLMRMMAAGPATRVPKVLYLHWNRPDGMVAGWKRLPYEAILSGWQQDLRRTFLLVDEKVSATEDRHVLRLALTLQAFRALAARCRAENRPLPRVTDIHPEAPALQLPENIERFGPEIAEYLRKHIKKSSERHQVPRGGQVA